MTAFVERLLWAKIALIDKIPRSQIASLERKRCATNADIEPWPRRTRAKRTLTYVLRKEMPLCYRHQQKLMLKKQRAVANKVKDDRNKLSLRA